VRALPQPELRGLLSSPARSTARGGRHRPHRPGQVPRLAHVRVGCPYKKSTTTGLRKGRRSASSANPRIEAGQPTVVLGDLRGPHPLSRRAALRRRRHRARGGDRGRAGPLTRRSSSCSSTRTTPPVVEQARADGIAENWIRGGDALARLQDGGGLEDRLSAASRIPHAADGVVRAAAVAHPVARQCRRHRDGGRHPDVRSLRIPVRYLANLLTAGQEEPIVSALERMLAMPSTTAAASSARATAPTCWRRPGFRFAGGGHSTGIWPSPITRTASSFPKPSRERRGPPTAEGSCGFTFGNGCDFGPPHSSLFGGKMGRRKLTPVRPLDT